MRSLWMAGQRGLLLSIGILLLGGVGMVDRVYGIDVKLTLEEAIQVLAQGREPMEKAESVEDVAKVMKAAEQAIRVGADPQEEPCGTHAILRTRRYWLGYFGRREAAESKRQKTQIRMPEAKIQEILGMPYLEIEVRLCGDDEFFAEGAEVALQQGSRTIRPVDVGPAERGRKNPGSGPAYRSRFTARFAYEDFDPNDETTIAVFFMDGRLINLETDFSQIK